MCLPSAQWPQRLEPLVSLQRRCCFTFTPTPVFVNPTLKTTQPYLFIICVKKTLQNLQLRQILVGSHLSPPPAPPLAWARHTAVWKCWTWSDRWSACVRLEDASGSERFDGTCIRGCYQVVWDCQGSFSGTSRRSIRSVLRWSGDWCVGSVPTVSGKAGEWGKERNRKKKGRLPALDGELCSAWSSQESRRPTAFSSDLAAQHKCERGDVRTMSFITGEVKQHSSQKNK